MITESPPLDDGGWELLPSYADVLRRTYSSVMFFSFNASMQYTIAEDWDFAKSLLMRVPRGEVIQVAMLAITLTVMRALLSAYVFEVRRELRKGRRGRSGAGNAMKGK